MKGRLKIDEENVEKGNGGVEWEMKRRRIAKMERYGAKRKMETYISEKG